MNSRTTVCTRPGPCRVYLPGHLMHPIHARRLHATPWGWRDGTLRAVDGANAAVVDYLHGGSAELWHHLDLSVVVLPGTPVRLHERLHALQVGDVVLNVLLLSGLGAVPTPEGAASRGRGPVIAVDLQTGHGLSAPPTGR
ncbi:hypothetical protein PU560_05340 [Georgenia sp. 10Sc9-8]|uniref:Uncharacterized protein n=1 Tax=Georgenia halotolerans TaxID=3028317 RepID=A0ABT5TV02_9MICO|nr:hypothetical protein [Georgenia halotolerans]